jgi:hypothetical protein
MLATRGEIKRFMEYLTPRGVRVVALEKPTEAECGQWYFQRYVLQKLPYKAKNAKNIGSLDNLIVGRAHVVYERGERPGGSAIL